MKAAILVKTKAPLVVEDVILPNELFPGQVLVNIEYSGICGAQINEIDAVKGPDQYLPHLLGHEGVGTVIECGPGVTTVNVEDRVVLHWRPSAGIQSLPPKYGWGRGEVNAGWVTTFNETAVISENRLTVIPKEFDMKLAPLFGCAITTAFGVVNNDAQVKVGQSVVVYGLGGVGLNIVQAASMVSAYPIVGIDIKENKIEMAKKMGLSHGFLSGSKNFENNIKEILGFQGADVVIETTGNSKIIEQAYDLTSSEGKTILVGVPKKGQNISIYSLPLHFNKILTGSEGGSSIPDLEIPRYLKLMEAKKMTLDGLITHEFPLDEVNEAIDLFRSGEAGRIILNLTDS